MPRSLAEIVASLAPTYDPQKALLQQQQDALPGQQAADQAGLDQTKTNAFQGIVNDASSRGVVYGGAPINEQQTYLGSTYLPAVANLKNTYAGKQTALEQALLGVNQNETERAQTLYDNEVAQEQQAARDKAAAAAAAAPGLSLGGNYSNPAAPTAAAPQGPPTMPELQADIAHFITPDWATRWLPGFTERTLIPTLQKEYPQFAAQIPALVYSYRKQYETPAPKATPKAPALSPGLNAMAIRG